MKSMWLALGLLITSFSALAADLSNGADNFYTSEKVTVAKVAFNNQYGMQVVGNLFTPQGFDRNAKHAAIIVGHPMGAVKEQSANLYATKMAEQGFVTLSLDLSFWGESEGAPRNEDVVDAEIVDDDADRGAGERRCCRGKQRRCQQRDVSGERLAKLQHQ